jgi:hypothetical protein
MMIIHDRKYAPVPHTPNSIISLGSSTDPATEERPVYAARGGLLEEVVAERFSSAGREALLY